MVCWNVYARFVIFVAAHRAYYSPTTTTNPNTQPTLSSVQQRAYRRRTHINYGIIGRLCWVSFGKRAHPSSLSLACTYVAICQPIHIHKHKSSMRPSIDAWTTQRVALEFGISNAERNFRCFEAPAISKSLKFAKTQSYHSINFKLFYIPYYPFKAMFTIVFYILARAGLRARVWSVRRDKSSAHIRRRTTQILWPTVYL